MGKTVNCAAPLPLALWSSLDILSACARRALANKRERGEERYLPENGGISTWGLQSRLWSRAAEARASERAMGRRGARLSYYATASLSLSAARRSTELFNEAWLSHNVFCSWMSLSVGLDFLFSLRPFFFFLHHLFTRCCLGINLEKVWPLKNHWKSWRSVSPTPSFFLKWETSQTTAGQSKALCH